MSPVFLRAEWRKLAMANYVIDPDILIRYIPFKTELDIWEGKCYVSLVGFMFLNTTLKGVKIPFHTNFEEVNLRFYVKHRDNDGNWKRGVVFIKEIVPKPMLTLVANSFYKENYVTLPMKHTWQVLKGALNVEYSWKKKNWHSFQVGAEDSPMEIETGTEEEFITEHYWGYTKINDQKTSEYAVEHPRWKVYPIRHYHIDVSFEEIYGSTFEFLNHQKPASVFLAEGSEILVRSGFIIR